MTGSVILILNFSKPDARPNYYLRSQLFSFWSQERWLLLSFSPRRRRFRRVWWENKKRTNSGINTNDGVFILTDTHTQTRAHTHTHHLAKIYDTNNSTLWCLLSAKQRTTTSLSPKKKHERSEMVGEPMRPLKTIYIIALNVSTGWKKTSSLSIIDFICKVKEGKKPWAAST